MLPNLNGYQYCLTIIDRLSRWPEAIPLKNILAETITKELFAHWISRFDTPVTITSDQGSQFESALFQSLAQAIGAKKLRTIAYHPQSNGLIERWHRTLKAALMCSPKPWFDILPFIMIELRTAFKEDIQTTPAELVKRRHLQ